MKRAVIICLDGCDPEYLRGDLPNFRRFNWNLGKAVVPTTTNVNVVSILTGTYPKEHGITSNFYYDRRLKKTFYMESADFILVETITERLARLGLKSALITAKEKLRTLVGRGATISFSAERPLASLESMIGPPPHIYSIKVNEWLFMSLLEVINRFEPDLSLLITTDYLMHKFPPESREAKEGMKRIDFWLGELLNHLERSKSDYLVFLVADHGMSDKRRGLDLERILRKEGISAKSIPIIKDKYVAHHQDLGGSSYLYLEEENEVEEAKEILLETEGVEEALNREEASSKYCLHPERIGDIMVLGEEDVVFGKGESGFFKVNLRSHGSLHERRVPILVYGEGLSAEENKDVCNLVFSWIVGE